MEWVSPASAPMFERVFHLGRRGARLSIEHMFYGEGRGRMATSSSVRFLAPGEAARRSTRRNATSHPRLGSPQAHPARQVAPGNIARVTSCVAVRPAVAAPRLLALKVAAVSLLAVVGGVASVVQFAAAVQPDPAYEYVAGDPGWAHVDNP